MRIPLAPTAAALALVTAGCGSSHATPATTTSTPAGPAAHKQAAPRIGSRSSNRVSRSSANFKPVPPAHHHDSGGGAGQFRTSGGDNSVQNFGAEASSAERLGASSALHGFFDARAHGEWKTACFYLSAAVKRTYTRLGADSSQLAGKGCAAIVATLSSGVPHRSLTEAAQADVGSLRFQGDRGFLLYHGFNHTDFAMPMLREGDRWKVAAAAGSPLN